MAPTENTDILTPPSASSSDTYSGSPIHIAKYNGHSVETRPSEVGADGRVISERQISSQHSEQEPVEIDSQYLQHAAQQPDLQSKEIIQDSQQPQHWRSWILGWLFNIPLIFLTLSLVAFILALDQVSAHNNGIVTIPNFADASLLVKFAHIQTYYGLLWTALPSFIFTLYHLLWAAVVSVTADRQPFVELKRSRGSTARRTILLDYRTSPSIYSWFVAFRNNHQHIGFGMVMSLLVSVAVVPLSAHLLVAQPAQLKSNTKLSPTTTWDISSLTALTNFQPFIDVATAVHAYDTNPPPWMTNEYAFERYTLANGPLTGNISFPTTAYSGLLDCQIIPSSQYTLTPYTLEGTTGVTTTFSDRGCTITQSLPVGNRTQIFSKTFSNRACDTNDRTRVGILTALYSATSPNSVSQFTITSCIPSYWSTTGLLTQTYTPSSKPSYVSFTNTNDTELIRPGFDVTFESPLPHYSFFDVSSSTYADAVGFAVYTASLAATPDQSPKTAMISASIQSNFENIYATIFASLARNILLQPDQSLASHTIQGTLTQPVTRLFIVRPIAYVIITILLLVLACNVLLFAYARRHETMLEAEPVGLLGNAVLLRGGRDVFDLVDDVRRRVPEERDVVGYLKRECGNGKGERCWWDDVDQKIRVEGIVS